MFVRSFALMRVVLVVCAAAVASQPAVARAQSPIDGFDPGANGVVSALAVLPNGEVRTPTPRSSPVVVADIADLRAAVVAIE